MPLKSTMRTLLIFLYRQNRSSPSHSTIVIFRHTEIKSTSKYCPLTRNMLTGYICRRILTCLIALRILRGHLPSRMLLDRFPVLDELFSPFITAIRTGDITAYDTALDLWERRLVELNLWITIEKARELCIRGLFRRVYVFSHSSSFAWQC